MINFESDGQAAAWYHNKILRIEHGKRVHTKRYLSERQVLELFDGEVRVEEKIDGKLNVTRMNAYEPKLQEYWVSEILYSKNTVHNHIITYSGAPHQVWLNSITVVDNTPKFGDIRGYPNTLGYGTIKLPNPTMEQILKILEVFASLPSHYGTPKIEGLVVKNDEKQLCGKFINEEFEDKIEEQELKE